MAAIKSIPLVGEIATFVDGGAKATIGLAAMPFHTSTSNQFFEASKTSFADYAVRSPVAATVASAYYLGKGDHKLLKWHWRKVGQSLGEVADTVPGVGHGKGLYHYYYGDRERGHRSMKAASKSTARAAAVAVIGGTSGAVPPAAVSVATGLVADGVITGIDSVVYREYSPYGHIASATNAVVTKNPVAYFDAARDVVYDFTLSRR